MIIKGRGFTEKAILEVETYNDGQGTRIRYQPGTINPYTMIGVLEQIIVEIKNQNSKTEKRA
jgi:hypothetical protein